ncbi:hypothetical protein LDENG_00228530 [Lucifuga dentata]|nr:hypothetical protein LDENG_00228530 [Lucifuga dentata]
MSESQNNNCSSLKPEERNLTPEILISESDEKFFQSLYDFIEYEKQYLQCPAEGADEQRYMIYCSVFNKVIGRATAYKRLLVTIKAEYDDVISTLRRREGVARAAQRKLEAATSRSTSVMTCRRQAAELKERISVLQKETSALQEETERRRFFKKQTALIPGLTLAESEDVHVLDRHVQRLEVETLSLMDRRSCCISVEIKAELDGELQAAQRQRDHLRTENHRLNFLFLSLLVSSQWDQAALHAVRSPHGILRSSDVMQTLQLAKACPGSAPPPLVFFRALLVSVPPGGRLSAALSLHGVRCALQQGSTPLVSHAVAHRKLTFSEALGDALTEHAQNQPHVADVCLALATIIYEACGANRKSSLSMCKRGLVHGASEFMTRCNFTPEDCMWVLSRSPSLSLLQLLTEPCQGRAAILSVGVACSSLLVDPQQQQLALQLLDGFFSHGVLQEVMLEDGRSSVELWADVASLCSDRDRRPEPGPAGSPPHGARLPVKPRLPQQQERSSETRNSPDCCQATRAAAIIIIIITITIITIITIIIIIITIIIIIIAVVIIAVIIITIITTIIIIIIIIIIWNELSQC